MEVRITESLLGNFHRANTFARVMESLTVSLKSEDFFFSLFFIKISHSKLDKNLRIIENHSKSDLIFQDFLKMLILSERVNVARNVSLFIIEDIYG